MGRLSRAMTRARQAGHFVAVLAALGACDQGKPRTPPAAKTGHATTARRDAALADVATPDTASPHPAVQLPGKPAFGCIGWEPATKTVACITGTRLWNQPSVYTLEFLSVGEARLDPLDLHPTDFDDAFEPASAATSNNVLAGQAFQPLTDAPQTIDKPGTHTIGKTARLMWTSKLTHPGGDNIAPTYKHHATVACGRKTYELADSEREGVDPTFEYRLLDGFAIVETSLVTGREGEYGADVSVLLLNLATCDAATSVD